MVNIILKERVYTATFAVVFVGYTKPYPLTYHDKCRLTIPLLFLTLSSLWNLPMCLPVSAYDRDGGRTAKTTAIIVDFCLNMYSLYSAHINSFYI
jgi:hypothetical protein